MGSPRAALFAAMAMSAAPAAAAVTEPNGLVVPLNSNNGETRLDRHAEPLQQRHAE